MNLEQLDRTAALATKVAREESPNSTEQCAG